jgi:hypothetical protein
LRVFENLFKAVIDSKVLELCYDEKGVVRVHDALELFMTMKQGRE